jgi:hypothetical protein
MTGKILGRFRMKLSTPRFCRGLTDSNNEAFHRRQLTNGDVTSPQALTSGKQSANEVGAGLRASSPAGDLTTPTDFKPPIAACVSAAEWFPN